MSNLANIEGDSCYFCHKTGLIENLNDVENDQTNIKPRPGLSFIASSLASELVINLLHYDE
jgi:hypothetical protein